MNEPKEIAPDDRCPGSLASGPLSSDEVEGKYVHCPHCNTKFTDIEVEHEVDGDAVLAMTTIPAHRDKDLDNLEAPSKKAPDGGLPTPEKLLTRCLYLAYKASKYLTNQSEVDKAETEVWDDAIKDPRNSIVRQQKDGIKVVIVTAGGRPVFMSLGAAAVYNGFEFVIPAGHVRVSYQLWASAYPSYQELIKQALFELQNE